MLVGQKRPVRTTCCLRLREWPPSKQKLLRYRNVMLWLSVWAKAVNTVTIRQWNTPEPETFLCAYLYYPLPQDVIYIGGFPSTKSDAAFYLGFSSASASRIPFSKIDLVTFSKTFGVCDLKYRNGTRIPTASFIKAWNYKPKKGEQPVLKGITPGTFKPIGFQLSRLHSVKFSSGHPKANVLLLNPISKEERAKEQVRLAKVAALEKAKAEKARLAKAAKKLKAAESRVALAKMLMRKNPKDSLAIKWLKEVVSGFGDTAIGKEAAELLEKSK